MLLVCDLSRPLDEDGFEFAQKFAAERPGAAIVAVLSKSDLPRVMSPEDEARLREMCRETVAVSVERGEGLDELAAAVGSLYDAISPPPGDAVIWSAAQSAAISSAGEQFAASAAILRSGGMPDAACTTAESALSALMRIDGRGVSEEIVRSIFSRFCVGK